MKSTFFVFSDNDSLAQLLKSSEFNENAYAAESVLFQIYSSRTEMPILESIVDIIKSGFPSGVIIGSTAAGGILDGTLYNGSILISISFFEKTTLKAISIDCVPGEEYGSGLKIIHAINEVSSKIAGVLLMATTLTVNISEVFSNLPKKDINYPIFGGGTGVYNSAEHSFIFDGNNFSNSGIIALVFIGTDLQIFMKPFFGWSFLSKEMKITETDGLILNKIDESSAFDVYKKYLDLHSDNDLFKNILEFPFLIHRDGQVLARVPYFSNRNGSLKFLADIKNGDKLHIGYADPVANTQELNIIEKDMRNFKPDTIFLFVCICRLYQLQKNIEQEIRPFNLIAPTAGHYTYGEFYSQNEKILYQNATILFVGMREGKRNDKENNSDLPTLDSKKPGKTKLIKLVKTISSELEQTGKELTKASGIEKSSQIFNKTKPDIILKRELRHCRLNHTCFSLILLEIENYDMICSQLGILAADNTLQQLARAFKKNLKGTASLIRFDNSKILIVLPETDLDNACITAEKFRNIVSHSNFDAAHLSCSMGVTSNYNCDDHEMMLTRVKNALSTAKENGNSKIVSAKIAESK